MNALPHDAFGVLSDFVHATTRLKALSACCRRLAHAVTEHLVVEVCLDVAVSRRSGAARSRAHGRPALICSATKTACYSVGRIHVDHQGALLLPASGVLRPGSALALEGAPHELLESLPPSLKRRARLTALELYGKAREVQLNLPLSWWPDWRQLRLLLVNMDSPTRVVGRKGWSPQEREHDAVTRRVSTIEALTQLASLERLVWCENSRLLSGTDLRAIGKALAEAVAHMKSLKGYCFYNDSGGHYADVYTVLAGHPSLEDFSLLSYTSGWFRGAPELVKTLISLPCLRRVHITAFEDPWRPPTQNTQWEQVMPSASVRATHEAIAELVRGSATLKSLGSVAPMPPNLRGDLDLPPIVTGRSSTKTWWDYLPVPRLISPFEPALDPRTRSPALRELSLVMNLSDIHSHINEDGDDEDGVEVEECCQVVRDFLTELALRFPRLRALRLDARGFACAPFGSALGAALADVPHTAEGVMRLSSLQVSLQMSVKPPQDIVEEVRARNPGIQDVSVDVGSGQGTETIVHMHDPLLKLGTG